MTDLALEAAELERVRAEAEQILAQHTGRRREQVRHDTDLAVVLSGVGAVQYGLADSVPVPASGGAELDSRVALRPGM